MKSSDAFKRRRFLFLQGPPGPLFALLSERLVAQGHLVRRINLNGGDKRDWPDRGSATDYRGRARNWPQFVHDVMERERITDLILYGDCRPMHIAAVGMADIRGVAVHVLEEGYIRPDWMTWEPEGVNGHSLLPKDPRYYLQQAGSLPPIPDLPPVTASFKRRAHDSYWHYHHVVTNFWRFPLYRTHRPWLFGEGIGWLSRLASAKRRAARAEVAIKSFENRPYFLLPLQLSTDYQIKVHSPFQDMESAAQLIMQSFARHAPDDSLLVVKDHPLYCGALDWGRWLRRRARHLGIADRMVHISGGDLAALSERSLAMVTVNSTAATLALAQGRPVKVLGEAVYDMPGITDQQRLDRFWQSPTAPDSDVWQAFHRVLHSRCLVRGGLASQSAVTLLIDNLMDRLERGSAVTVVPISAKFPLPGAASGG